MRTGFVSICAILATLSTALPCPAQEKGDKLTDRQLDNLVALTRLMGYVRYFHPSDESAAADWDVVAIDGVKAVIDADGPAELAKQLENFFQPLAPTLRVYVTGKKPDGAGKLDAADIKNGTRVMIWRHLSVPPPRGEDKYSSARIELGKEPEFVKTLKEPPPLPRVDQPWEAELGGGVSCTIPMALPADDKGTLPRGPKGANPYPRPKDFAPSAKDRAVRLGGVMHLWNCAQHFYPYFDVMNVDWPRELREGLKRAAVAADDAAHVDTLRRMISALRDGHGTVSYKGNPTPSFPPLRWDWMNGKLVILQVASDVKDVVRGDVVLKINGVAAREAMKRMDETASGATPWFRQRVAVNFLAMGPKDSDIELEVHTGEAKPRQVTVKRTFTFEQYRDITARPNDKGIEEIKPGIWLINLGLAREKEFIAGIPKLEKAKGVLFDLRGMQQIPIETLLGCLTERKIDAVPVYLPVIYHPDRKHISFMRGNSGQIVPTLPRLKGKAVFLSDVRAISSSETMLSMVREYKLAEIVGRPTAGSNGNIRVINLPGGFSVQFTGIKVLNYDGTTFHGKGVEPTVEVTRSMQGIRAGRDEVLERALAIVEKG